MLVTLISEGQEDSVEVVVDIAPVLDEATVAVQDGRTTQSAPLGAASPILGFVVHEPDQLQVKLPGGREQYVRVTPSWELPLRRV